MSGGQIVDVAGNSPTIPNPTDVVFGANHVAVVEVPAATASADGDGTFKAGETVFIKLDFNEAVSVTGAPKLMLSDGGVATFASGSGTDELTFAYTVGAKDNANTLKISSVSLPSGSSVTDDATGTHPANFANMVNKDLGVVIDTVAPTVTSVTTSPTSVLDNAGKTINFTVNTSEAVNVDITNGKPYLQLDDGEHAVYSGGTGSKALTFQYTVQAGDNAPAGLKVTSLNLGGGAIADLSDNAIDLSKAVTATFSGLHVDTTAPTIIKETASPATGSLKAGTTAKLTVTFSEVVTVSGPNPTLSLNSGMGATATYASGSGTNTLTFNYTVGAHDSVAALAINSIFLPTTRIMDAAGNDADLTNIAKTFTGLTIDTTAPTVQGVTATPGSGTQIGLNGTSLIKIDMGEALKVSGTPTLTLSDGETATYVAASSNLSTGMLAFSYKAGANHTTGDLQISAVSLGKGAAVTDVAGNAADFTFTGGQADLGLIVDTTPPHVTVASSPASGMRQPLGVTIEIDLQADEAVTVNGVPTITLSDGGTAVYDAGESHLANGVIAFDYIVKADQNSNDLKVTALTIPSGASIKDLAGNAINASTAANQDVGVIVDTNAPTVSTITKTTTPSGTSALISGDVVHIDVTLTDATGASDVLNVNGTPGDPNSTAALMLNDGGEAVYQSRTGNVLHFDYTVQNESTTDLKVTGFDFTNGSMTDGAGNAPATPITVASADLKLPVNVFNWTGASHDGLFDTSGNWNPSSNYPQAGNTANIALAGTYTVTSKGDSVGNLNITDAKATLEVQQNTFAVNDGNYVHISSSSNAGMIQVDEGATFELYNTNFANSGTIKLNNANSDTFFEIINQVTLTGKGQVMLSTSSNGSGIIEDAVIGDLINVDNTISGNGVVGKSTFLTVDNQIHGTIVATAGTAGLTLNSRLAMTNEGTLEAAIHGEMVIDNNISSNSGTIEAVGDGATIVIDGVAVTNTATGVIEAINSITASSVVELDGATISNGMLKTSGTAGHAGTIHIAGAVASTINGVTNTGALEVNASATLEIAGPTFNNTTTAIVQVDDSAIVEILGSGGGLTLQGGGKVNLAGGEIVSDGTNAVALTNADNAISGIGTIGDSHLSFVNGAKGIVNANDSAGGVLDINTHSFTNSGLVEATGHGVLDISSNITDTTTGLLKAAAAGAHVDLDGVTVTGGTVSTVAGSFLDGTSGSSTINTTAVLTNAGRLGAEGGDLTITGAVNNTGILDANGHHLSIGGAVSGTGTGTIENNGILEFAAASSAKITFVDDTGTLQLDAATTTAAKFTGTIANFGVGVDNIILGAINYTTGNAQLTSFVENSAHTSGVLTVNDGTHTETLTFTGNYTLASFMTSDVNNHVDLLHV